MANMKVNHLITNKDIKSALDVDGVFIKKFINFSVFPNLNLCTNFQDIRIFLLDIFVIVYIMIYLQLFGTTFIYCLKL